MLWLPGLRARDRDRAEEAVWARTPRTEVGVAEADDKNESKLPSGWRKSTHRGPFQGLLPHGGPCLSRSHPHLSVPSRSVLTTARLSPSKEICPHGQTPTDQGRRRARRGSPPARAPSAVRLPTGVYRRARRRLHAGRSERRAVRSPVGRSSAISTGSVVLGLAPAGARFRSGVLSARRARRRPSA